MGYLVHLKHADGIHLAACRANRPGNEAFYRFRLIVHAACSPVRPLWRSRASTDGSRPRKATNNSMGSRLPPRARILSRKERLNSSHVKISYAVFCLKKKKEWRSQTTGRRPPAAGHDPVCH